MSGKTDEWVWWDLIHYARCDVSFLSIEQWSWYWDGRIRNKTKNKRVLAPWEQYAPRVNHNPLLLILSHIWPKKRGATFTIICSCCPEIRAESRGAEQIPYLTSKVWSRFMWLEDPQTHSLGKREAVDIKIYHFQIFEWGRLCLPPRILKWEITQT